MNKSFLTKGITQVKWRWISLAKICRLFVTISTHGMVWCIGQATQCCSGACLTPQCMPQEAENCSSDSPHGVMHCLRHLELLIFCINGLKLWDLVTVTQIKPKTRRSNFTCWCIEMESSFSWRNLTTNRIIKRILLPYFLSWGYMYTVNVHLKRLWICYKQATQPAMAPLAGEKKGSSFWISRLNLESLALYCFCGM